MNLEEFELPIVGAFDVERIFSFFHRRALPGVERVTRMGSQWGYYRTVWLPGGPGAVGITYRGDHLHVLALTRVQTDAIYVRASVRHLFDLDAPIEKIDSALAGEVYLAGDVERYPGTRLPGALGLHETLLRAIVGQQITVARAREVLGRLVERAGAPFDSEGHPQFVHLSRMFPTADDVLTHVPMPPGEGPLDTDRTLQLPRRSIQAVREASESERSGTLRVEDLLRLPGVGPWTNSYVKMRYLKNRDTWLPNDVALVAGAKRLGLLPEERTTRHAHHHLATAAQQWQPWRSYAVMRLWSAPRRN